MGKCLKSALIFVRDADKDDGDSHRYHGNISLDLFERESAFELTQEQEIIGVEVDSEQEHEDCRDPLNIGRIAREAVCLNAESAGTRRSE